MDEARRISEGRRDRARCTYGVEERLLKYCFLGSASRFDTWGLRGKIRWQRVGSGLEDSRLFARFPTKDRRFCNLDCGIEVSIVCLKGCIETFRDMSTE